jgi:catechol 2,3-dioxygenase-like lactoylglutathione lyase family enzyme
MQPALTHIALHVRDLDACLAFYREFCGMRTVHERTDPKDSHRVVWLAESGKEKDFIIVMVPGGPGRQQGERDYSHFGFALESRAAVDAMAAKATAAGCLIWPPRQEPFPATIAACAIPTAISWSSATASRSGRARSEHDCSHTCRRGAGFIRSRRELGRW